MLDQISIFVENKPGRLAAIMEVLNNAAIDIRAFTIADTTDFGIVRLIASDTKKAISALKENGFTAKHTLVIGFTIPDYPGAMNEVISILQKNEINIEYSYSLMGKRENQADIAIRVQDNEKAEAVLKAAGIKLISTDDVCNA